MALKFLVELRNRFEYTVHGPFGSDEQRDQKAAEIWASTPGQLSIVFWKAERVNTLALSFGEQYKDEDLEQLHSVNRARPGV